MAKYAWLETEIEAASQIEEVQSQVEELESRVVELEEQVSENEEAISLQEEQAEVEELASQIEEVEEAQELLHTFKEVIKSEGRVSSSTIRLMEVTGVSSILNVIHKTNKFSGLESMDLKRGHSLLVALEEAEGQVEAKKKGLFTKLKEMFLSTIEKHKLFFGRTHREVASGLQTLESMSDEEYKSIVAKDKTVNGVPKAAVKPLLDDMVAFISSKSKSPSELEKLLDAFNKHQDDVPTKGTLKEFKLVSLKDAVEYTKYVNEHIKTINSFYQKYVWVGEFTKTVAQLTSPIRFTKAINKLPVYTKAMTTTIKAMTK